LTLEENVQDICRRSKIGLTILAAEDSAKHSPLQDALELPDPATQTVFDHGNAGMKNWQGTHNNPQRHINARFF
jgi:hypothetical protein